MILSHLTNQPQFRSLKRHVCYRKFISLLSKKWQKAIAFVYIKNDTLFVALTHPGFKMELHYNRDLLKSVLTQLASHDPKCHMLQANKVAIFHSRYHTLDKDETPETIPYYNEHAQGDFNIRSDDDDLVAQFKQTQALIQCRK